MQFVSVSLLIQENFYLLEMFAATFALLRCITYMLIIKFQM